MRSRSSALGKNLPRALGGETDANDQTRADTLTRNADKKPKEEGLINRVKSLYSGFPEGELMSGEEPDFLVAHDNVIVGIELTEYIRGQRGGGGSLLRAQEETRQKIMAEAARLFSEKSGAVLNVYAHWNPNLENALKKTDITRVAEEIAKLVLERLPSDPSERGTIDPWAEPDDLVIDPYITLLSFQHSPVARWSSGNAGFMGTNTSDIQWIISGKDKKIYTYRKKCQEVWLVIVADGSYLSSIPVLDGVIAAHQYQSTFDRVLFCDLPHDHILNLNIAQ
jgi:hypothetical protein